MKLCGLMDNLRAESARRMEYDSRRERAGYANDPLPRKEVRRRERFNREYLAHVARAVKTDPLLKGAAAKFASSLPA